MSEERVRASGLNRRSFLKAGAFGVAAAGAASAGMFSFGNWLAPTEAYAEASEEVINCYHQNHCFGNCALTCTVRDGRLVLVEPNAKWEDDRHNTICARGISEVQHVYSIERVQTPMKRIGPRGSDEFVSITWDEALDLFKEKITSIQSEHGTDSVLFWKAGDAAMDFIPRLLKASVTPFGRAGSDIGQANAIDPGIGHYWFINTTGSDDWVNAKTILILGSNMFETRLVHCGYFFDAMEAGAETIMIDPSFTPTAGSCSQWLPINSGTDAALMLAMTSLVLDNKWYDEEYIRANTSLPFLVDVATGELVHGPKEDAVPIDAKLQMPAPFGLTGRWPEEDATFLVWDENTESVKYFAEKDVMPALTGVFEYEGRKVTPTFALLLETQKPYTAAWAAEKTGISEEDIVSLATRYATNGPAVLCLAYGGGDKYANADVLGHAALILASITGNIGIHGGGLGGNANDWAWHPIRLAPWALPEEYVTKNEMVINYDLLHKENNIRAIVCFGDMLYARPPRSFQAEYLDTLDFVVVCDIYYTPGTAYADLILPVCTKFENESEVGDVKAVCERLMLRNKVLDPLFESKSDFETERVMAAAFGLDHLMPKDSVEFVNNKLNKIAGIDPVSLEKIKANNDIYTTIILDKPWVGFEDQVYGTPSRRIEVYRENVLSWDQALPRYEDPMEVYAGNPLYEKYPLQLMSPRTRFQIHEQFFDATWLQEIKMTKLEMNPIDMQGRGLENDDIIEVFNDRGSFKCKVATNNSLRPGIASIYECVWPKYLEEGDLKMVLTEDLNPRGYDCRYGPVIQFYDMLVEVKKA